MEHLLILLVSLGLVGFGAWFYEKQVAKRHRRRVEDMLLEHGKRPKL